MLVSLLYVYAMFSLSSSTSSHSVWSDNVYRGRQDWWVVDSPEPVVDKTGEWSTHLSRWSWEKHKNFQELIRRA